MKHKSSVSSILIILIFLPTVSYSGEILSLSVKNLSLENRERIVGFQIRLKSAYIYSLPELPIGWAFHITNFRNEDPPWNTSLDAVAGVGNASLNSEFFRDFILIEKYGGKFAEGSAFDIELRLSTTSDFEKINERSFSIKGLILKPTSSHGKCK
jgi:hypothetical protein